MPAVSYSVGPPTPVAREARRLVVEIERLTAAVRGLGDSLAAAGRAGLGVTLGAAERHLERAAVELDAAARADEGPR